MTLQVRTATEVGRKPKAKGSKKSARMPGPDIYIDGKLQTEGMTIFEERARRRR